MAIVNFLLIPIWCIALIMLHESGHAIAGRLLGFKIFWISIGNGRPIAEIRALGIKVTFNLGWPIGETLLASRKSDALRVRWWLAILAGPATHLAILALIYFLVGGELIRDSLRRLWFEEQPSALAILFSLNAILLVDNLLPFRLSLSKPRSDGYRLVTIPFLNEQAVAELRALYNVLEAQELVDSDRAADGLRQCLEAISVDPGNAGALILTAIAHMRLGQWREGRDIAVALLNSEKGQQPIFRNEIRNSIAWGDLFLGESALLQEADAYSAEALGTSPNKVHFRGPEEQSS